MVEGAGVGADVEPRISGVELVGIVLQYVTRYPYLLWCPHLAVTQKNARPDNGILLILNGLFSPCGLDLAWMRV